MFLRADAPRGKVGDTKVVSVVVTGFDVVVVAAVVALALLVVIVVVVAAVVALALLVVVVVAVVVVVVVAAAAAAAGCLLPVACCLCCTPKWAKFPLIVARLRARGAGAHQRLCRKLFVRNTWGNRNFNKTLVLTMFFHASGAV